MRLILIPFLVFCLLSQATVWAQVPRAQYRYQVAIRYKSAKQTEKAIAEMHTALKADPAYAEAYGLLGKWLYDEHRFGEAAQVLQTGSQKAPKTAKAFSRLLAKSLLRSGNPAGAQQVLQSYPGVDAEWNLLNQQARFANTAGAKPWLDQPINLGPRVNTPDPELFPQLSADGQTLYFTRRMNGMDEDFFKCVPDSCGGWFTARNLGSPPNTLQQEAAQMISADRHYLFFMRCDNRSQNGWAQGGCDLMMAYTADSIWSTPESFGATINTPGYEGMPCLSADNRELFFVSDRTGGFGGLDVWVTKFEHGLWQAPRNLGPEVNTAGDETAPFLHADGQTLFFASNGQLQSFGGSDLFKCQRKEDSLWTGVENLGAPINTPYDEASFWVNATGDTALFASDRNGPAANFDLYSVAMPETLRPQAATYVKGFVTDSISHQRLSYTHLFVADAEKGNPLFDYMSNRGDGSFMMVLRPKMKYAIEVIRMGYQSMVDTFYCEESHTAVPDIRNYALLPYNYQKPLEDTLILSVNFQKNSTSLSDSDQALILQHITPFLEETASMVLVNSYTDDSGTPLGNTQISQLRANEVGKCIQKLGFTTERMQIQGWGDSNPVAPNNSDENRYLNRRVEIVVRH